ncbi:MAG: hypothetical protein AM324_010220 [Candidatus Thorarchaeota archaeon SMTZ1-83]
MYWDLVRFPSRAHLQTSHAIASPGTQYGNMKKVYAGSITRGESVNGETLPKPQVPAQMSTFNERDVCEIWMRIGVTRDHVARKTAIRMGLQMVFFTSRVDSSPNHGTSEIRLLQKALSRWSGKDRMQSFARY